MKYQFGKHLNGYKIKNCILKLVSAMVQLTQQNIFILYFTKIICQCYIYNYARKYFPVLIIHKNHKTTHK